MGNTATKESRQSSASFGTTVLLSSTSRVRADRGNAHPHDAAGSQNLPHHSGSREASGHRKSRRADNSAYKMIVDRNETVDGGYLFPQGVYHGTQDFKVAVVREMIIQRRLAPFYKGLDLVDPNWSDEELLSAVNSPTPLEDADAAADAAADTGADAAAAAAAPGGGSAPASPAAPAAPLAPAMAPASPSAVAPASPKHSLRHAHSELPGPPTKTQQIWLYRNVHECPICFLVYPRLNATRCCGQDICTECFVQIKRNAPHPPYTSIENSEATDVLDLISEPSCCPYCAQTDLGVIFEAPPFEWGIPSSASQASSGRSSPGRASPAIASSPPQKALTSQRPRRTSVPASHPSVVTVDMIRPDWEDKLASARRRLARKSAAARALHRSALIPNEDQVPAGAAADAPAAPHSPARDAPPRSSSNRPRRGSSLADIVEASRSMSAAQTRALERKMIEEAIQASLQ